VTYFEKADYERALVKRMEGKKRTSKTLSRKKKRGKRDKKAEWYSQGYFYIEWRSDPKRMTFLINLSGGEK